MVNVEADVMVGPILAKKARAKGLIYSMAYGDQPALICEMVDWVRACGFDLIAAGKGMNFEPRYRYSTPDTVWGLFGWSEEMVAKDKLNPRLYNSFTDGTKAAIEMAAVANATGLSCPEDGLAFPPAGVHDLARVFRPVSDGGRLAKEGLVDIAASQEPDGREVSNNIRYGVFVTFKAHSEYARACFKQYGLLTDPSGWYASLWRPFHLIGLEASVSVLSAVLRGEATGSSIAFRGDAVATAKKDMQVGDILDGEGGYAVWANAIPAERSRALRGLPIGLAHYVKLTRPVAKDQPVSYDDVDLTENADVVALRQEMERRFVGPDGTSAG
jgi:predicted homoserine dehydrogenase-like protein